MRNKPECNPAQHMQWLFGECGLYNTRKLLFNFLAKRAEWWAYTQGREEAMAYSLENLRTDLKVDMEFDPVADWGTCGNSEEIFFAFLRQLAGNGTKTQQDKVGELERAWTDSAPEMRFDTIKPLLFTQVGEPRSFKPTKNQNAEAFLLTREVLFDSLQEVRYTLAEQQAYRLNEAVLHCGAALLDRYQTLKQQKQQMDFSDLEWQLCHLLQNSDHAETMQYKLDCRYRHVLLDEFQDTNPLQWQTLRAWFDAAVAVESRPTVFIVGDPKQSIYRFRRADARLFGVARDYLKEYFAAHELHNNHTRRNALPVVTAVNAVFREQPEGFEFAEHETHQKDLPGCVLILPLEMAEPSEEVAVENGTDTLTLRDPLTTPRAEKEEGARHKEAGVFAETLQAIAGGWVVTEEVNETKLRKERRAAYSDVMVLVRGRTHLAVYEAALRAKHIPFISSRRGGLLDTLEAADVQALLTFLITPFADLSLAQVLRTPIFACSDDDLMRIAAVQDESSWWVRLQQLAQPATSLQRAKELLQGWLALADKLPVHDLLDRIYFEGDVLARYAAVLSAEMRAKVTANLHAFMEIALSVDAGRYPSLPRFLQELREFRDSRDDAPDEGRLGSIGNAVRIYTVHEAKGLEAPIVWLLDANTDGKHRDGNDVLVDWPPQSAAPAHFSLYTDQNSRGRKRAPLFEQDAAQQAREEMNLLYVAMTRAQQTLIVSGNGRGVEREQKKLSPSWYDRIAAVVSEQANPLRKHIPFASADQAGFEQNVALPAIIPTGKRASRNTMQQQRGIWLHALLQHLTDGNATDKLELQQRFAIPDGEIEGLWQQARNLLASPQLARFFDSNQYRSASNEMPYVNARGELKRIDRLVEFDDELWVLDYKFGDSEDVKRYRAQMQEYRTAMQAVYAGKKVHCALLFADGILSKVE
jgi:ATP-dependent helicase/nuclease subunit A